MASISLPPQPQTTSFSHYLDSAPHPAPGHSRRNLSMSSPLPNPPFVFPARDPGTTPQTPERKTRNSAPLPAFSFNPGATHSSQPSMPTLPVNRPGGHRRRCSELIGNDRLVAPGTVEANKDNNETPDPAPAPAPAPAPSSLPAPGPGFSAGGPGRRRHAHRRSAAISSVDLSAIRNTLDLKPPGSSPSTPTDPNQDQPRVDPIRRPISYSAISLGRPTPPASPRITINGETLHPPQPESPVSPLSVEHTLSETPSKDPESTATTCPETAARNSNVTGDSTLPPQHVEASPKPRPRTADASLMLSSNANGRSDDMSRGKRPLSATGHSRFRKSLSSGVLDAALRRHNMGDHPWADPRHSSSDDGYSDASADEHGSPGSGSKKRTKAKKRQKKVRSWAGSILTRGKGKRQQQKKDLPEAKSEDVSAPVITRTNSDLGSGLDVDFDDDNIVVIRTPTNPNAPRTHQAADDESQPTLENSWKPRSFYEQDTQQNDTLSPIIDLDAALGPFNTPDMGSRKLPESGFSAASRRMYSGGRRGEFIGPEMRYHRRAESAPALPPFDRSFLASSRLSSNFAMENPDVFYEEEEDAFLAATSESEKGGSGQVSTAAVKSPIEESDKQSVRSKESSHTLTHQRSVENIDVPSTQTGLGIEEPPKPPTVGVESKTDQQQPDRQDVTKQLRNASNPFSNFPKGPIDTIKQQDWHQKVPKVPIPPSPDISPRFTPADQRPATSPLELTPNIPQFSLHGGSSISNSSFPSPDFTVSSDAPRSVTTSSTDRNFSNPSYNQSMDFPHASVEDVPSLTSSASTMTNTLNRFSANFFQRPRLSTDRSASFSAAVHRRSSQPNSSKRSSLASLSKLVAGPASERSKLSYEEKPPSDDHEKARKKGRRISRLMHFWRTKDKDRLNDDVVREEHPS